MKCPFPVGRRAASNPTRPDHSHHPVVRQETDGGFAGSRLSSLGRQAGELELRDPVPFDPVGRPVEECSPGGGGLTQFGDAVASSPLPAGAESFRLMADQVGEGAMRRPVPDLSDRNDLRCTGRRYGGAYPREEKDAENGRHLLLRQLERMCSVWILSSQSSTAKYRPPERPL